ncbi:hypothetical protein CMV_024054 [Castanea mollissima]|uniref:UDP-galactose/UDP-glucose transporter 3 n=1 Tax=Castanea mollissima TaxID=60419 RepID=A0A8J4QS44_9ROSI|nr:hypothetical protein CMV_024054 [Castanea mollissima]
MRRVIKLWSSGSNGGAPWWTYWSAGITNTIGPAMGIEALKYISYPAQVLEKSSKMIPVMLMGALVYGIRYTVPEYLCTFLVAGGVSTFCPLKARSNAPLGYLLCFLNLTFDGFTNATQDSITTRYPKTSAWDIMRGMNLWGTIYNMIYMFGWPHASGFEAVQFCKQHPEAAWDIFLYCLCGAVGQNFIFLTISRFGSLADTTITTTRKFVSIVVSSLLSGNPLSTKQWGCVAMVFSGLSYQIYLKWRKLQRAPKKRQPIYIIRIQFLRANNAEQLMKFIINPPSNFLFDQEERKSFIPYSASIMEFILKWRNHDAFERKSISHEGLQGGLSRIFLEHSSVLKSYHQSERSRANSQWCMPSSEGDSQACIKAINNADPKPTWRIQGLLHDVKTYPSDLPHIAFIRVHKEANAAAHSLATWSFKNAFVGFSIPHLVLPFLLM